MKHTNTNDTPMTTSTEIAQKIDLGFDYVNLIGFRNEDELRVILTLQLSIRF